MNKPLYPKHLRQLYALRVDIDTWMTITEGNYDEPMPRAKVVEIYERLGQMLECEKWSVEVERVVEELSSAVRDSSAYKKILLSPQLLQAFVDRSFNMVRTSSNLSFHGIPVERCEQLQGAEYALVKK